MDKNWQGLRCLVTGGAGFGGSHLCAELISRCAKVYVLDRSLPNNSFLVLEKLDRCVEFLPGDVRDLAYLKWILHRFEIETVFHLAAQPIVPISNLLPYETFDVNAMGTCAVLEASRLMPDPPRLVVASSAAYYGRTSVDEAIREDQEPRSFANLYSASKVAADVVTRCYAQVYDMRAATCRFMNTFGPGDSNFSRIIPRSIRLLIRGEPFEFGDRDDGNTRLDFVHVRDVACAYIAVAEHLDECRGEAFNIGSGTAVRLADLTALISTLFDGSSRVPTFGGRLQESPPIKYLEIGKAAQRLGWSPRVSLEQGLGETIGWYRDHWEILD